VGRFPGKLKPRCSEARHSVVVATAYKTPTGQASNKESSILNASSHKTLYLQYRYKVMLVIYEGRTSPGRTLQEGGPKTGTLI